MMNEASVAPGPLEVVVDSPMMRVEVARLAGGKALEWQRCPVADRVLVVTEGRGHCYRSHGRDEICDEIGPGDVVYLKRMVWHRVVALADQELVGTLVTSAPADVEMRR